MPKIVEVILESLFTFMGLFILARVMGKRQIAQLTFFDYISGITLGSIAASLSLDEVRFIYALSSLVIWSVLTTLFAWLERKSYRARILIDGRPIVLIENGQVLEENLKRSNMTIEEMMLLIRQKNVFKLSDVEYAIFESNGSLSVMKKSDLQPMTPKDAGIPVVMEHEPRLVIIDGHVMEKSLQETGYSKSWLLGEIMKRGASDFRDVFIAQIDANGNVFADLYHDKLESPQIKQKALLAASLKKVQADLETFSLQTENPETKKSYVQMTAQLKDVTDGLLPLLRD